MFYFLQLFVILLCFTDTTGLDKSVDGQYEMHCDCGRRETDHLSEMDCEESARLETQQQAELFQLSSHFFTFTILMSD